MMATSAFSQIIVFLFLELLFGIVIAFANLAGVDCGVFEHGTSDCSFLVSQNLPLALFILFILMHLFSLLKLKFSLTCVWYHFV